VNLRDRARYFEDLLWPHLRGAYNFARWIVRNEHDAEDVVQEAFAKAYQAFDRFRGGDPRVWLMTIVHNTAISFLRRRKSGAALEEVQEPADGGAGPEQSMISRERRQQVRAAIEELPADFREAIILREIEGLSYKEIAAVLDVPIGTVMSRLARARGMLLRELVVERGQA
jgi:RNA polymerase sigma-70 factor (ECF subfamily)